MRDCPNVEMRELLPDFAQGDLAARERSALTAHLERCDDCRAELRMIEQVRAALPAIPVDAARIARAIPPYRATPVWMRAFRSMPARIAAAAVILATSAVAARQAFEGSSPATPGAGNASQATIEVGVSSPLADLSVGDLEMLVASLDELEAVLPDEGEADDFDGGIE